MKKYTKAEINKFKEGHLKGNANYTYKIGLAYIKGNGVKTNKKEGFDLLNDAAKKDHPKAMFYLSKMYRNGEGIRKNNKMAFEWCKRAAEKGYPNAMNNLSIAYMNGEGVSKAYSDF